MKFILTMIICSSVYQQCLVPFPMPDKHSSHYECMIAGYEESIKKAKQIGPEDINKYGTVIKFYCLEESIILPKPKPKVDT
jgi:hypothetical protein